MRRFLDVCCKWFLDRLGRSAGATSVSSELRQRPRTPVPANPLMYELFVTCIADRK